MYMSKRALGCEILKNNNIDYSAGEIMRKLSEIINDIMEGKIPSHEECYHALQVYRLMFNIEHKQLRKELLGENRGPYEIRRLEAENSFNMFKNALNTPPDKWYDANKKTFR